MTHGKYSFDIKIKIDILEALRNIIVGNRLNRKKSVYI